MARWTLEVVVDKYGRGEHGSRIRPVVELHDLASQSVQGTMRGRIEQIAFTSGRVDHPQMYTYVMDADGTNGGTVN